MSIDLRQTCEQTVAAVRDAGALIREHWDKPRTIRLKGRIDLVTETDVAVERALRVSLADILPQATFLAEEKTGENALSDCAWVVDPLDGTTNFAHGLPFVAVSVGLWLGRGVGLGVIYNPILDELYAAVKGQGAFCNGTRLRVTTSETLDQCVVATGFPYTIRENIRPVMAWLEAALTNCRAVRRFGAAALDLAYLAAGRFDGFYEAFLHPWDAAAGWLLVEEAGGRVTKYDANKPYALGSTTLLASNGRVHEALSSMLRETGYVFENE
jgi:myo-inositol-1(or 4)-monophosphatase